MDTHDSSPSDFDHAGRISKPAFLISTGVLLGIVIISFLFRMYIRLVIQRQISLDDGFIAAGLVLLCAASGLFYRSYDGMYLAEAFLMNDHRVPITGDTIKKILQFYHALFVGTNLQWCAINMVKLSFLALFKKLVKGLRPMIILWWTVLAYTLIVWIYGLAFPFATCESGNNTVGALVQCVSKSEIDQMMRFIYAQLTLDVFGDILIAAIPFWLIWQVRVRWTQKVSLFSSLCLSIFLIAVTITRASGLVHSGAVDVVWNVFWLQMSTQIGLILSITTAFRAFYVTRQHQAERARGRYASTEPWYHSLQVHSNGFFSGVRSALRSRRQPDEHHTDDSAAMVKRTGSASDVSTNDPEHQLFDLSKPQPAILPDSHAPIGHDTKDRVHVAIYQTSNSNGH